MISSKNEICNLALGHLGNYQVVNIDNPKNDEEFVCKRWYDITRESALREGLFNFAIKRRIIPKDVDTPVFGYSYQYSIPNNCLRILSVGDEIEDDKFSSYSIENNKILSDTDFEDGMPIRYIEDIQQVGLFNSIFIEYLSLKLAVNMCFDLNNDKDLKVQLWEQMNVVKLQAMASDAQESRPVIVNNSRYKNSRYSGNYPYKRRIY